MKSVLLLTLFLLISSGVGRLLLHRFTVLSNAPLERFAYGTAIGLGIGALGVFALGMIGQLSFLPITLWWALLAAVGLLGTLRNVQDLLGWMGRGRPSRLFRPPTGSADLTYAALIAPVAILALLAIGLFCICACFQPPTGHEWDALAYHLADPKVYLAQNRISLLPTEHHSNFPFLMEMLYSVGLLYDNFPLANLFHLTMGILTLAAILGFCRRILPGHTGWIAVLLLATTPVYLWECCVAYIDVGMGLYVTLAAFAGIMMIETACEDSKRAYSTDLRDATDLRDSTDDLGDSKAGSKNGSTDEIKLTSVDRQRRLREWGILAGTAAGIALGIKYLALIPFALLPLLLLSRRVPPRQVLMVVGIAAIVGCPWYLKNIVWMHNPVYPFLFKLFPASRYWSADRATVYQAEQAGFGFSHALALPGTPTDNLLQTLANLVQTPWHFVTTPIRFINQGDFHFMVLLGGLYAAGILPLVFLRRIPRPIVNLLLLFGSQLLAWFFVAQHVRYLVYLLPLGAVIAAYGWSAVGRLDQPAPGRTTRNLRLFPTLCTLVLTGQVLFVMWALCALPTSSKVILETGMMPTALTLNAVLKNATEPDTQDSYLDHNLDTHLATSWLNQNTPKTAGVVFYDEVCGFYLDRPYLWGDAGHSSYIPYDQMKNGADLSAWMLKNSYRYVLINLNKSARRGTTVTRGHELELLRQWYEEDAMPGTWRYLLADALRRRLWIPTPACANGVVVLEVTDGEERQGSVSGSGRSTP